MPTYRTEIVIPADRYVCLQLPAHLPRGSAVVVVHFDESASTADEAGPPAHEDDRHDIEWWEEFDEADDPGAGEATGGP